jgi:hypothetical protein
MFIEEGFRGNNDTKDRREQVRLVPVFVELELDLVQVALKIFWTDFVIGASQSRLEIAEDRRSTRRCEATVGKRSKACRPLRSRGSISILISCLLALQQNSDSNPS